LKLGKNKRAGLAETARRKSPFEIRDDGVWEDAGVGRGGPSALRPESGTFQNVREGEKGDKHKFQPPKERSELAGKGTEVRATFPGPRVQQMRWSENGMKIPKFCTG